MITVIILTGCESDQRFLFCISVAGYNPAAITLLGRNAYGHSVVTHPRSVIAEESEQPDPKALHDHVLSPRPLPHPAPT